MTPRSHDARPLYDVALLTIVVVWGVNFPIIKQALAVMHPFALNVFRFAISTVTLGAVVWLRRTPEAPSLGALFRNYGKQIVALGLIGNALYQVFFILGIARTTAGTAALIMASAPAWTVLVGHIRGSERTSGMALIGLGLSLCGTILVVLAGPGRISFSGPTFIGNMLMLGASMMWGTYTALARATTRYIPPVELTLVGLLVSLPILVLLGVPFIGGTAWGDVTWEVWLAILYSGALSTGLAVVVWNLAVKHTGAGYTSLFGNLVPLVALTAGALFLNEPLTWPQLVGGSLAIGGVLLIRFHASTRTAAARGH